MIFELDQRDRIGNVFMSCGQDYRRGDALIEGLFPAGGA
jgi:hypothetical protein